MGGNKMIETKEELINELKYMINKHRWSWKDFIHYNKYAFKQIYYNCISHKCPNLSKILFNNKYFYICYDNWSSVKVGWHIIYTETLDLCFEHKKEKYLKGEKIK
jgi:hypothetical protein